MSYLFKILLFGFALETAASDMVLKSAVSDSFRNGLHFKFTSAIANKLNKKIKVHYAPFARRLRMLELGQIDFLVGLSYKKERESFIYYIKPGYYKSAINIFYLNESTRKPKEISEITPDMKVAVIRNSSFFKENEVSLNRIESSSIENMIKMLVENRIDAFIHNKAGGEAKIKEMNFGSLITSYQLKPLTYKVSYIGISKKSMALKDKKVIEELYNLEGLYQEIRSKHYSELQ